MSISIFTDGACRNNGRAVRDAFIGLGVFIIDQNQYRYELFKCIRGNTNNEAEYEALIFGLEEASKLEPADINVYMDSELIVRQMKGIYRVKNPKMKILYDKVNKLMKDIMPKKVTFMHIRRELNGKADSLANKALDEKDK